jgi:hypothetical protein
MTLFVSLLITSSWFALSSTALAQQEGGRVKITSSEMESAPNIILRAFAVDGQGEPLPLQADNIIIFHNGQAVNDVRVIGEYQAGTFTIFMVDVPGGLQDKLQPIQEVIEQFSNTPYMDERADYIALYRVGATGAEQLLSPSNFHNTIRDFFSSTPLQPATEQTALADSVGNLLGQISILSPKGDMATSIVLITDGTDVVSKNFDLANLGTIASSMDIPVHTIWIENEELRASTRNEGRGFLTQLSGETNGLSANLADPESFAPIWNRIGAFRNHQVIEYIPVSLQGGKNEVTLSITGMPGMEDSVEVSIPQSAPSVEIVLPQESREISLDSLEDPVRLSFTTSVSWLDDILREITNAELLVNQIPVQEIPVSELDRFTAEINYFSYGPNDIQVRIEDELGQTATSPVLTLVVNEGKKFVPEEMRPSGILDSPIFRTGLLCLALFVVVAILALVVVSVRQYRARERARRSRDRREMQENGSPKSDTPVGQAASAQQSLPSGSPYLEVVTSVTRMPPAIGLSAVEHRIGRSSLQADIVFENDITVSRLHASIVLEGTDYRIYDEGSSSGTWVNNQQVPEYGQQLQDGDEIRLGDTLLRYHR